MAIVNQVTKKVRMSTWDIVRYQILTHCYINKITVSEADLDCLTFLAIEGDQELSTFCAKACDDQHLLSSAQSVRNCLAKAEKKDLIRKIGKNKKKIFINPDLGIYSTGNILLDYKILSIETS